MSNQSANNKRIAKNTLMLYIRMLFLMFINLYTSRVILKALGIEDYGIYNAVGGFVAMFAIISSSLSVAISRFITFEISKGTKESINKVFSTSMLIMAFIGVIVIIMLFSVGLWFLNTKMTIPLNRLFAANWIFIVSGATFVVNLISIPYNACIIAFEKMSAFAYIGIIDAIGRLLISFMVIVSPIDKLIFYVILLFILSLSIRVTYGWYCNRNFDVCKLKWIIDKSTIKEIFEFAGWNFIGSSSGILKEQGINILLNIFSGPTINAARGIAVQVSTAVTQFSQNFITAINPQITKSYASGKHEYMMFLVEKGAKLSYFMLFTLSLPIIINTPYILNLWLGEYPDYSVIFIRLILISSMHESISSTLVTAMLATGKIKNYQIVIGGILFLNVPASYIALKLGYPPESVLVVSIILSVACLLARIYMLRKMINLSVKSFIANVYSRILLVSIISFILPYFLNPYIGNGLKSFIASCAVCLTLTLVTIYFIGCSKTERTFINEKLNILKQKIKS